MARIFHFISQSDFLQNLTNHELRVPSLATQGFIHCSTKDQVVEVANFITPGREDMALLEIETSKVLPPIVYENLEGGEKLFPHIYGPLNQDAIIATHPFLWRNGIGYLFPTI